MGLYLPAMKMPTGNDELRLIIRSNGQVIISHETYYEEAEAVPVSPHGRLIDADALLEGEGRYIISFGKEGIDVAEINRAPTIIPAEEES